MVEEESSVAWTRRPWVWALVLVLVAAATLGGLALAGKSQRPPAAPELHIGSLAKLPDGDFANFLPTRADFPKTLKGFLTLTAEELREHPEPALPTDPPQCDPTAPLRSPTILGEVRTDSVVMPHKAASAYTIGVTRETSAENLVVSLGEWLAGCPEAALPSASNSHESRQRKLVMRKLPDPSIGADRSISYSITIIDSPGDGTDAVLYPPQTQVMTLAVVRGVALYCLARDTSLALGEDERAHLLSNLVQRIRTY